MGLILRKLLDRRAWEAEPATEQGEATALADFERRPQDTDGLSVFEVTTEEDREVVLAALAIRRGSSQPVDLIEVDREVVEQFGELTPTSAESEVYKANELHRSLDWPQDRLDALARALYQARTKPRHFNKAAVKRAIGRLADDDVASEALDLVRRYRT